MTEVPQTLDPEDDKQELARTDRARCGFCNEVFRIEDLTDIMLCRPCDGDED